MTAALRAYAESQHSKRRVRSPRLVDRTAGERRGRDSSLAAATSFTSRTSRRRGSRAAPRALRGSPDHGLKEADLAARVADIDALIVRSETKVTAPILDAAKRLVVVGRAGVGVDNIDVPAATARGVYVVNAPLGNIVAAAEHTIALALALLRRVVDADRSVRAGEWTRSKFIGRELRGKTLGLVGVGRSAARSHAAPVASA